MYTAVHTIAGRILLRVACCVTAFSAPLCVPRASPWDVPTFMFFGLAIPMALGVLLYVIGARTSNRPIVVIAIAIQALGLCYEQVRWNLFDYVYLSDGALWVYSLCATTAYVTVICIVGEFIVRGQQTSGKLPMDNESSSTSEPR